MKDALRKYTCIHCKERYEMLVSERSRRSMTGLKGCCNDVECMTLAAMKSIEARKAKENKAWKERKEKGKIEVKTIAHWKKDLQDVVNWIVKQIDKDLPCISHPELKGFLRYDAGHYFTVKAHSDIRFNVHNIHKQNSQSNERNGGDGNYVLGIKKRYGNEYLEMMLGLPLKYKGIGKEKYTIANIRDIYLPEARKIKREIEKGLKYNRDQVNKQIGIYL